MLYVRKILTCAIIIIHAILSFPFLIIYGLMSHNSPFKSFGKFLEAICNDKTL